MKTTFVIGYDISEPKRLQKVYRVMLRHATPIGFSVFVLEGSAHAARQCMKDVSRLIKPDEDDLRCYPLPKRGARFRMGRAALPEGIIWTGLPSSCIIVA
jgi:CRISPR-associated endonuclease Cas2